MRRYASLKSFLIGMVMTFFIVFDVPVFWPILLMYWCVLFFVTMKRQIRHMIKYKYVPFTTGKKVSPPPLALYQRVHQFNGSSLAHGGCRLDCMAGRWLAYMNI